MPFYRGIHFKTEGHPANPAVVFLHGFMGNCEEWNPITAKLTSKYFCIALDLPGHGQSTDLDSLGDIWTFKKFCNRLNNLAAHLGISNFSLVGYSMGGRIAFHFSSYYPDRLLHLIIESSSPGLKTKSERNQRLADDIRLKGKLTQLPLAKFLSLWYALPVFRDLKNHPDYDKMIRQRLENDVNLLAKGLIDFSTGQHANLEKKLSALKTPVCLICGKKDQKYEQLFSSIKKNNPHFKLSVIPDCSHNVHFEKPDQFAENLIQFLS